jgi:hypothetical protein
MASLESLTNPLERLNVLPTAMNFRKNPATSLPFWNVAIQYFINDVVISPLNNGAYICSGGTQDQTAVRGGVDPSLDTTGIWYSTSVQGVSNSQVFTSTVAIVGAANVITLPAGASLTAPALSTWLVVADGSTSCPLAITAADYSTYTFTANGAGAVSATLNIQPLVGPTTQNWGSSAVVSIGTGGTTITATGAYAGQVPTVASGLRITYIRIA